MKFAKEVKFLSYDLSTLGDGKSVYARVGVYDADSRKSIDTGFMCSQNTAELENYLSMLEFGDSCHLEFILRPAEKANTYKLGVVGLAR